MQTVLTSIGTQCTHTHTHTHTHAHNVQVTHRVRAPSFAAIAESEKHAQDNLRNSLWDAALIQTRRTQTNRSSRSFHRSSSQAKSVSECVLKERPRSTETPEKKKMEREKKEEKDRPKSSPPPSSQTPLNFKNTPFKKIKFFKTAVWTHVTPGTLTSLRLDPCHTYTFIKKVWCLTRGDLPHSFEIKTHPLDVFLPNKIKISTPSFSIDFINRLDWSYFPQNKIDAIFPKIEIKTRVLISVLYCVYRTVIGHSEKMMKKKVFYSVVEHQIENAVLQSTGYAQCVSLISQQK